ncbi:MAG TPA: hypothetical protein VFF60_03455 [Candidatus Binatus sp.]|nr:hypothetical protein [Candidatus Binatus sp.]
MQSTQAIVPSRFLMLSPAGMAIAFAVLAFLRGLFAWPLLALFKAHMASTYLERGQWRGPGMWRGGANPGASTLPGGPPSGPGPGGPGGPGSWQMPGGVHGAMGPGMHHMAHFSISPFTYVLIWLATIVVAAVAGAILAFIYNWVASRSGRTLSEPATTA